MMRSARWRPDTCGCILEYEWDDTEPIETRTHSFKALSKKCEAHKTIVEGSVVYSTVKDENQRKNRVLGEALKIDSDLVDMETLEGFNWLFDKDRVLHVNFTNMTTGQKNQLRNVCNNRFGVGKVTVE